MFYNWLQMEVTSKINTPYLKMAAILVFLCLLPRSRENILLNSNFKNEATSDDLKSDKRTLKCPPFWNKVYLRGYKLY